MASRMERFSDSYTLLLSDRANPQMWVPVWVIADRPQGSEGTRTTLGNRVRAGECRVSFVERVLGEQAAANSGVP